MGWAETGKNFFKLAGALSNPFERSARGGV
jgi:hypothetical protein